MKCNSQCDISKTKPAVTGLILLDVVTDARGLTIREGEWSGECFVLVIKQLPQTFGYITAVS